MVMDARLLMFIGFALVLIGMIIVAFAMLRRAGSLQGRSMGFILLGPIPIVWQGSRSLLLIVPIALLIAIIFFIMVSMR
ncbi:hypothetical protein HRbin05_00422 [archaeon HR05]|nr:hypothetical protein HRbin05_00422 [archaeon HR05]